LVFSTNEQYWKVSEMTLEESLDTNDTFFKVSENGIYKVLNLLNEASENPIRANLSDVVICYGSQECYKDLS